MDSLITDSMNMSNYKFGINFYFTVFCDESNYSNDFLEATAINKIDKYSREVSDLYYVFMDIGMMEDSEEFLAKSEKRFKEILKVKRGKFKSFLDQVSEC